MGSHDNCNDGPVLCGWQGEGQSRAQYFTAKDDQPVTPTSTMPRVKDVGDQSCEKTGVVQ